MAKGAVEGKGNRCLTDGRRAFLDRVAGIEAGAECERFAPLSVIAVGRSTRTGPACRAALGLDHLAGQNVAVEQR